SPRSYENWGSNDDCANLESTPPPSPCPTLTGLAKLYGPLPSRKVFGSVDTRLNAFEWAAIGPKLSGAAQTLSTTSPILEADNRSRSENATAATTIRTSVAAMGTRRLTNPVGFFLPLFVWLLEMLSQAISPNANKLKASDFS